MITPLKVSYHPVFAFNEGVYVRHPDNFTTPPQTHDSACYLKAHMLCWVDTRATHRLIQKALYGIQEHDGLHGLLTSGVGIRA